jgi:hypothetical protein
MAKDVDVLQRFATANDAAVGYINRVDTATSKFRKSQRKGSIVKEAQKNVFEFPVFVSNTIPLDFATATVSLLEQVYATYLQMAVSLNPIIDAASAKRGVQFADYKTNTNKYLEYTDTTYQHDVCHAEYINEDCKIDFDLLSIDDKEAKLINEAVDYQPLSEFEHFFQEADEPIPPANMASTYNRFPKPKLNDDGSLTQPIEFETDAKGQLIWLPADQITAMLANAPKIPSNGKIPEANALATYFRFCDANKLVLPSDGTLQKLGTDQAHDTAQTRLFNAQRAQAQAQADRANNPYYKAADAVNTGAQAVNSVAMAAKNVATLPSQIKDAKARATIDQYRAAHLDEDQARMKTDTYARMKTSNIQYVRDADCQKLNTMKPLLMKVTLNMLNKDDSLQPVEYVIGVKCHTRMIQSSILPEVAQYPLKEMDKVSRKVKWRAGELKFFKDLVFRIKEKKQTAADARDPNRKWYRRLYELAHMQGDAPSAAVVQGKSLFKTFIKDKQGKGDLQNGMIPNATIVMSQSDVDFIKGETEIDLLKPSSAKKFCGELFLMSLVIIDTDRESIKILLPDMNEDYDVHSLAAVNKQLATLDTMGTKTRDIFKVLGA